MKITKEIFISNKKNLFASVAVICLLAVAVCLMTTIFAVDQKYYPKAVSYEMSENSEYAYEGRTPIGSFSFGQASIGRLVLTGTVDTVTTVNGVQAYGINGTVRFGYEYNGSYQTNDKKNWNLVSDSGKKAAGYTLDSAIREGVLIIEKSTDGKSWSKIAEYSDFFSEHKNGMPDFLSIDDKAALNGVYYRFVLAYEMSRRVSTGVFTSHNEYIECVEVYTVILGYDRNPVLIRDIIDRTNITSEKTTVYGFSIDKAGSLDRVNVYKDGKANYDVKDGQTFSEAGRYTIEVTSPLGNKFEKRFEISSGLTMTSVPSSTYLCNKQYEIVEALNGKPTVFGAKSVSTLYLAQKDGYAIDSSVDSSIPKYGSTGDGLWVFLRLNYSKNLKDGEWYIRSDEYGQYIGETVFGMATGRVECGALVIQTSKDGLKWEDASRSGYAKGLYTTDFINSYKANNDIMIYAPSGKDILNGIYIRVTLAYQVDNRTARDTKKYIEQYTMYLCNGNLDAVVFHNLSVKKTIRETLATEDKETLEIYQRSETMTSGALTMTGFRVDKSLNPTVDCEVYKNDVLLNKGSDIYTETGRYDIYLRSGIGTKKHVILYVDRDSAAQSLKTYFNGSFIDGKRVYLEQEYPVFEGGKTECRISALSENYVPLRGYIKNTTTGTVINVDAARREKTIVLTEPGTYVAVLTTNPNYPDTVVSGDSKTYTYQFIVIAEGTAPGPWVNQKNLADYIGTNVSDLKPVYYGVTYSSAAAGNITVAFSSRKEAFEYAFRYESGIVEKQDNGAFRYTGSLYVKQKELIRSKWELADALDYFANQAVQTLYFDLSDGFTFTTLPDEVLNNVNNLRTLELDQSVVVFGEGQRDKLIVPDQLPIISPKPYRYLEPESGGSVVNQYSDFRFIRDKLSIDSQSIVIRGSNGQDYKIEYNKDVGAQLQAAGCPSGIVTIIETNTYGETAEYKAVFIRENDNTASITLTLYEGTNSNKVTLSSADAGRVLSVDAFDLTSITDPLDEYTLVLITKGGETTPYCKGNMYDETFVTPGIYSVKCVNRLGYAYTFDIHIRENTTRAVTISFRGDGTEGQQPIPVNPGQRNVLLPSLQRYGYILAGFRDEQGTVYQTEIDEIMFKGSVMLEAVWQAKHFNVQFVDQNQQVIDTMNVEFGQDFAFPVIGSDNGQYVIGWMCNNEMVSSDRYTLTTEGDLVFTAVIGENTVATGVESVSGQIDKNVDGNHRHIGVILIIIGAAGLAACAALVLYYAYYRRKKRSAEQDQGGFIDE